MILTSGVALIRSVAGTVEQSPLVPSHSALPIVAERGDQRFDVTGVVVDVQ